MLGLHWNDQVGRDQDIKGPAKSCTMKNYPAQRPAVSRETLTGVGLFVLQAGAVLGPAEGGMRQ